MAYVVIAVKPTSGTRYECRVYDLSASAPCAGGNHAPPPTPYAIPLAFHIRETDVGDSRPTYHYDQT
jgi:hypothetical protein